MKYNSPGNLKENSQVFPRKSIHFPYHELQITKSTILFRNKFNYFLWFRFQVSSQILVCTDARFPELKIQNVYHLIHYSMPTSWTQFTTRFSALAQTYDNFVSKKFEEAPLLATASNTTRSLDVSAHSMILLDEDNSLQLPRLVDFLRKHNQAVHSDILAVSKRVLIEREESRLCKGILLCPQLLEFGECDDTRCDKRHELTRFDVVDESEDIPTEGEMRIHILKVGISNQNGVLKWSFE